MTRRNTTVVVAMSGGVDSSVSAALLLEQSYSVIGVTMKTYEFDDVGGNIANETSCCGLGAVNDARAVAAELGIPHYVVDFRSAFERAVIKNFVDEYLEGRTPNPCINCNREIKWGELLRKADALGADFIATGHYARLHRDAASGRYILSRGRYAQKDQSYALWSLPQEALARTLFPLGGLSKPEVRERAARLGLRTAAKQESFEICFVPDNRYDRFLRERVAGLETRLAGGEVVLEGQVVGSHAGYPFYTIGQRRGIGAYGRRMYVTGIDRSLNRITIGADKDLYHSALRATRVNWSGLPPTKSAIRVEAKVRYKDDATAATVTPTDDHEVVVRFDKPKRAITPGQSVVWYSGDMLLGGGVIESTLD
ncbi:MAG: tRNA 2-thiouridine(34) synthase MnmA [Ignavibacteriales bacterium]|nr:tRNA 2-thiouridine(34) synthase MnmA [Ignavibacteriales bacterium]